MRTTITSLSGGYAMRSKTEILESAKQENVRFIRLQFIDLFGTLKNVEIPVEQLDSALDGRIMFDGSSIQGFVRIEESDMYLKPDYNTWLILPWSPQQARIARLICNVHLPDDRPFAGDPRTILQRAVAEAQSMGLNACRVAVELEFFLLKLDQQGKPTTTPNDEGGYFDIAPTDEGENCRRDIVMTLEEMGFRVASSHHETAPGQHEIDLDFTDAVSAADNIITLKMVARTISRQRGLHATFMPKPLQSADGSGMHCYFSLFHEAEHAFADAADTLHLSEMVRSYIAGLLFHAPGITAITNPLVNSYKRLIPGYEAPSYIFWSTNHRMPFIRVSQASDTGTHIELRSPDASCNPYLAFGISLYAGLDGIRKRMSLPSPVHQSIAAMSEEERFRQGIRRLPTNLEQAVESLEEDEIIRTALGEHAYAHFIQAKLFEWEQYQKTVHPWELNQYVEQY
ncbi:type I glutamate--ammonia ligase [Alicyclobacillus fodiniaquatilis]|uniref:Glutamine synthetase n=1 Tax=Alicyclobacillus fodiniaquatilis TaxID=1661150 RepID=A0ABW4JMP5_9BACL